MISGVVLLELAHTPKQVLLCLFIYQLFTKCVDSWFMRKLVTLIGFKVLQQAWRPELCISIPFLTRDTYYRDTLKKWSRPSIGDYRFNRIHNNGIGSKTATCYGSSSEHPSTINKLVCHFSTHPVIWRKNVCDFYFKPSIINTNRFIRFLPLLKKAKL